MISCIDPALICYLGTEVFRCFGAKISSSSIFLTGVSFADPDAVVVEDNVLIGGGASFTTSRTCDDGCIIVEGVSVGEHSLIGTKTLVKSGANVSAHAKVLPFSVVNEGENVSIGEIVSPQKRQYPTSMTAYYDCTFLLYKRIAQSFGLMWHVVWLWLELYLSSLVYHLLADVAFVIIAVSGAILAFVMVLLSGVIIGKWLLVGKLKSGDLPATNLFKVQYGLSLAVCFNNYFPLLFVKGGPLMNMYLILMGADVSYLAVISSFYIFDFDMLTIGSNSSIDFAGTLCPHIVNSQWDIRLHAYVLGGTVVRNTSAIGPDSIPFSDYRYIKCQLWCRTPIGIFLSHWNPSKEVPCLSQRYDFVVIHLNPTYISITRQVILLE